MLRGLIAENSGPAGPEAAPGLGQPALQVDLQYMGAALDQLKVDVTMRTEHLENQIGQGSERATSIEAKILEVESLAKEAYAKTDIFGSVPWAAGQAATGAPSNTAGVFQAAAPMPAMPESFNLGTPGNSDGHQRQTN